MAAGRRGLKIKPIKPFSFNQTLSHLGSPDHRSDVSENNNNLNFLLSNRSSIYNINANVNYIQKNRDLPESLRRWKNLDSSTTNYASNSDQLNLEDKSNAWYSSNQIRYETNSKNILKTEQDMPDFQVNMNAKYNIYDNMIIQGNDQQKYSTKAKITRNKNMVNQAINQCAPYIPNSTSKYSKASNTRNGKNLQKIQLKY